MSPTTVKTSGLREFIRAADHAGPEVKAVVRGELRETGEAVRSRAAALFQKYDAGSAATFGVAVRTTGVRVVQRKRKVTGIRPDYGALQMSRALLPAAAVELARTEVKLERAFDMIGDRLEGSGV